jgi:lysophospholipase L1-like esterase
MGNLLPLLTAALMLIVFGGTTAPAADPCTAPRTVWGGFQVPPRVTAAIRHARSLHIVAIGSSSTQGVGASGQAASYPARLAAILSQRFPGVRIEVANKGVGGETVGANLARLERDVLALKPDLVIWQVGTNDAFRHVPPVEATRQLFDGIARLKDVNTGVVLMEPQYLPDKVGDPRLKAMIDTVREVGQKAGVPVLPRWELMRHWLTTGQFKAGTMLGRDRLHMTDASYGCLAERVADLFPATGSTGIAPAATR